MSESARAAARLVLGRDTLEKGLHAYDKLAHRVLERNVLRHASPDQVEQRGREAAAAEAAPRDRAPQLG
jgi:hypothetical protein